jgi:hypothetical protein
MIQEQAGDPKAGPSKKAGKEEELRADVAALRESLKRKNLEIEDLQTHGPVEAVPLVPELIYDMHHHGHGAHDMPHHSEHHQCESSDQQQSCDDHDMER